MSQYTDLIKGRKNSNIKIAVDNLKQMKDKQEGRCAKCRKELIPGYFKSIVDPITKERQLICSDCLVKIAH